MTLFSLSYAVSSRQRQQYATQRDTKHTLHNDPNQRNIFNNHPRRPAGRMHNEEVTAKSYLPTIFHVHNFTQATQFSVHGVVKTRKAIGHYWLYLRPLCSQEGPILLSVSELKWTFFIFPTFWENTSFYKLGNKPRSYKIFISMHRQSSDYTVL